MGAVIYFSTRHFQTRNFLALLGVGDAWPENGINMRRRFRFGSRCPNVLNWTGLVYLCGFFGVLISGWSSDRTGERRGHCAAGQLGAALFLTLAMIPGQPWVAVFGWLCLTGFFAHFWFTPFWVLPTMTLISSAAAVSIGVINMCGNCAGALGSPIVAEIKKTGSDQTAMGFVAACYALGAVFVWLVRVPPRSGSGVRA